MRMIGSITTSTLRAVAFQSFVRADDASDSVEQYQREELEKKPCGHRFGRVDPQTLHVKPVFQVIKAVFHGIFVAVDYRGKPVAVPTCREAYAGRADYRPRRKGIPSG
jgi:hypothetical protein